MHSMKKSTCTWQVSQTASNRPGHKAHPPRSIADSQNKTKPDSGAMRHTWGRTELPLGRERGLCGRHVPLAILSDSAPPRRPPTGTDRTRAVSNHCRLALQSSGCGIEFPQTQGFFALLFTRKSVYPSYEPDPMLRMMEERRLKADHDQVAPKTFGRPGHLAATS